MKKGAKKALLRFVGLKCRNHRLELGYRQADVAKECYCNNTNVSAFERGENDSATLLCWYILHGLDLTKLEG